MGIREEIGAFASSRSAQCRVTVFLDTLSEKDRLEVASALADRGLSSAAFERWALNKHKQRVSDQSWARHRRGQCTCGPR